MKRFDISAKADPKTSDADLKLMLQSLLAERFKLVMHKGEVPMPAFLLTAPGGKSKMKQAVEGEDKGCKPGPPETAGGAPLVAISCAGMSLDQFAEFLNQAAAAYLTEPVLNQTGLEGGWNFTLKWTDKEDAWTWWAPRPLPIFEAVEEGTLDWKLELKTAPRSVWIVDSVEEKPTPNSPAVFKELLALPPAQFEVATIKPSRPDAQMMGTIRSG